MERSRNKLSKKQLVLLRSNKYIIFERSYNGCMRRFLYIKAVINMDMTLHKYTIDRAKRVLYFIKQNYYKELNDLGMLSNDKNGQPIFDNKARNNKLTFIND